MILRTIEGMVTVDIINFVALTLGSIWIRSFRRMLSANGIGGSRCESWLLLFPAMG